MPSEKPKWMKKENLLSYEEIEKLANIFVSLGINQIRLTGGEPLVREDLNILINKLKKIKGLSKISLTTNGLLLDKHLEKLKNAGLDAINISLDTLSPQKYKYITGINALHKIIENIEKAKKFDLQIKINCVVIKGLNDDEIIDMINFAMKNNVLLRFIEFMPLDGNRAWNFNQVITKKEILQIISQKGNFYEIKENEIQPAQLFMWNDKKFGIIPSISEPFCQKCNRLRLTSDGNIRTCLFSNKETPLKKLLREAAKEEEIKKVIIQAVYAKEEGFIALKNKLFHSEKTMHMIGG